MPLVDTDKLYTIDEVARLFQVSRRTIDRWIKAQQIVSVKIGRVRRITGKELQRLLIEHQEGSQGTA